MLKLLAILGLLIFIVLLFATTRPNSFSINRSIFIKAPPEQVFPLINNFSAWALWSPWEKKDPNMKKTMSGAAEGTGAIYAWQGNKNVGQGSMEITQSTAPKTIRIKLDFLQPFEAHNLTEFVLTPINKQTTELSWTMSGPSPYIAKLMGMFVSMDHMVGKDFEAGLAQLKQVAEQTNQPMP